MSVIMTPSAGMSLARNSYTTEQHNLPATVMTSPPTLERLCCATTPRHRTGPTLAGYSDTFLYGAQSPAQHPGAIGLSGRAAVMSACSRVVGAALSCRRHAPGLPRTAVLPCTSVNTPHIRPKCPTCEPHTSGVPNNTKCAPAILQRCHTHNTARVYCYTYILQCFHIRKSVGIIHSGQSEHQLYTKHTHNRPRGDRLTRLQETLSYERNIKEDIFPTPVATVCMQSDPARRKTLIFTTIDS